MSTNSSNISVSAFIEVLTNCVDDDSLDDSYIQGLIESLTNGDDNDNSPSINVSELIEAINDFENNNNSTSTNESDLIEEPPAMGFKVHGVFGDRETAEHHAEIIRSHNNNPNNVTSIVQYPPIISDTTNDTSDSVNDESEPVTQSIPKPKSF